MTISLTHKFVSTVPDGTDTSVVRPSNWNDEHAITGTLPVANGGTNVSSTPSNGQLLIGDGTGYTLANLTAGTGVTITNAAGGITISAPDTGTVTSVTASSPIASSGGNTPDISLTGTVDVSHGGTGQTSYTNGQLLIGNTTGNTLNKATLTAGTGVTITNGPGTITISAPDVGTVTAVTASSPLASSGGASPNISLTGTVAIANGGTNTTDTPTAGGVVYGTGTAQAYSAAGTAGYFLQSTGTSAPTWATVSNGTGSPAYYGLFVCTTNQPASGSPTANTANQVLLDSTPVLNNGVTVSGNNIIIANAGYYLITSELAVVSTSSNQSISVWLAQNGTNIANSAQDVTLTGGANSPQMITCTWTINAAAGDSIAVYWSSTSANVTLTYQGALTSPTRPASPSAIVNIFSLPQIGIGYSGLTSTTSQSLTVSSKTFTVNTPSTSSAFTVGTRARAAYTTTPANYVEGVITAYSGTSLTLNVDTVGGSGGPYASWNFSVAGNYGTVGGSNTQLQYNNSGALGGISGVTTDGTAITIASGDLKLSGATSGTSVLNAPATGGGTLTLPAGTTTLAGLGTAQTFTAAQTFSAAMTYGGVTLSNSVTGTGSMVLSAGPTFTGTVTIPTPFTLGAVSMTSTGTQLNYLNAATGTTGTTSSNVVFSASPTFTGTVTIPTPFTLGSTSVTATGTQLNYLNAATGTTGTTSSNVVFSASPTFTGTLSSANHTITSTSANAFAVGANGTTNPAFNVDASTASVATGLNVKGAAAGGGTALSVISSGTNENLTIDAKGSGTITIAGTSTGTVALTRAVTGLTFNGSTIAVPTRQVLTSGSSATYTTPANARQLRVRMVGGGGGGGGSSSTIVVAGSNGTATSFNSVTAAGGSGAPASASNATTVGGAGGTGGTGSASFRIAGGAGAGGSNGVSTANIPGGTGGSSAFGGGGIGGFYNIAAGNGATNSGGGGGGAEYNASNPIIGGGGGGAGEYVELIINSPAATYTYTVGPGGAGGSSTNNGGTGGSGIIIVDEFY